MGELPAIAQIAGQAWYTLKEACRLAGLPYSTVRHEPGRMPWGAQIVGSRLRYPRDVVVQWAAMNDAECARRHAEMSEQGGRNG